MKKYIRLKSGKMLDVEKILNGEIYDEDFNTCVMLRDANTQNYEYRKRVMKVGDKVTDLCDCYAVAQKIFLNFDEATLYRDNYAADEFVYGCFWTNKGLLYAAKYNKKGTWAIL